MSSTTVHNPSLKFDCLKGQSVKFLSWFSSASKLCPPTLIFFHCMEAAVAIGNPCLNIFFLYFNKHTGSAVSRCSLCWYCKLKPMAQVTDWTNLCNSNWFSWPWNNYFSLIPEGHNYQNDFYRYFFLIWGTPVLFFRYFQFTYWERKVEKIILYNKVHLLHVKMLKLSCLVGTIIYCVICQNPRFVFINRNTINAHKTGCHKLIVVDPKRQRWYGLFRNRQLMRKPTYRGM